MARPRNAVPSYLLHKPGGHAYVRLAGQKPQYLGKYNSAESRRKYARIVAEYKQSHATQQTIRDAAGGITLIEIWAAFVETLDDYYSENEARLMRQAIGLLVNYWDESTGAS